MHLRTIVVAGFLGSGKTTVLLELAKRLVTDGKKVAVVENEIGEVGIDGKYVAEHGLLVQELFGGCICCTLTVGLVGALEELARTFRPDYVLVEPTGIAQPSELAGAVREYSAQTEQVSVITVLDAERYFMLLDVIGPLLEGQIAHADVIAVNKTDAVESPELQRIVADVRAMAPSVPLVTMSEDDRSGIDSVLGAVL
jgi:G3E family GTPase